MSERFYKIGNTWYPWQTAHGLYGYTKTPTIRITYISTSQATWGQPEGGYGFFDGDASEPQDGSYFHTSTWGWFDADTMAKTVWLMPSECEIDDIFFENNGEISLGARLIIDPSVSIDEEDWRYLIASVRNLGWHTLDEWAELGWVLSDPNTLYFGGDFSGNNIRTESVDGGGGLIDKYASYKALFELRGWEPGGLFVDKPRMMGICGVLTETSDSVVLVEVPKQLSVGRIEFTGSLAEGGIPDSGVVEEYVPAPTNYIDIVLGLRWDVDNGGWLAKSFGINDWWWSGILSQEDLSRLQAFGCDYCQTTNTSTAWPGLIGAVKYDDGFYYDLLELYEEVGEQPTPMASGFYFAERTSTADRDYTGCLILYARYGYTTLCKSYKVRITKKEEYIDVILGFRWDTSLNDWRSINFDYALEDNNWWGCFISSDDATKVSRYGVEVGSAGWLGDNGGLLYSDDFTFEALEVYSELDQPVIGYDLSTFDIRSVSNSASTHMLSIFNTQRDATMLKFWKCRITRKVAPALPTVSTENDFGNYNWVTPYSGGAGSVSMQSGEIKNAYYGGTQQIVYLDTKSYGIIQWQTTPGTNAGSIEVSVVENSTLVALKNVSSNTISIAQARVAVCSSNAVEIVTVYDNQNAHFNAFKYNDGTTDYYYVLDDTQTDWTDDLSSIGYSLNKVITGYFTSSGSSATSDSWVYSGNAIFDAAGQLVYYDNTKSYTIKKIYNYSGTDYTSAIVDQYNGALVNSSSGVLNLSFSAGGNAFVLYKIQYTES